MIRKLRKIIYYVGIILLLIVAFVIGLSTFNIPGNIKLFTVQSGSMEPAIHTGSVVIVKPTDNYQRDDIITVTEPSNPKISVTHRISDIIEKDGKILYITKGDANNSVDTEARPAENVLGKVVFSLPVLGYLVSYARTYEGLLLLVIIPVIVIIFSELLSIKSEAKKLLEERKKRKLSLVEKVEVEIGEEEIKAEKWYKKLFKK